MSALFCALGTRTWHPHTQVLWCYQRCAECLELTAPFLNAAFRQEEIDALKSQRAKLTESATLAAAENAQLQSTISELTKNVSSLTANLNELQVTSHSSRQATGNSAVLVVWWARTGMPSYGRLDLCRNVLSADVPVAVSGAVLRTCCRSEAE